MKIGIIGAGITGLGLAYFMKDTKHEFTVIEKRDKPGGELMNTDFVEGFTFNTGGEHLLWSKYKDILDIFVKVMGKENLYKRTRYAKNFYKGKIIKYPFESGIGKLNKEDRFEFLRDFIEAKMMKGQFREPKNVVEWFYQYFGKSLSDKYLIPVNRTWWNIDPKELSVKLVERIPQPTIDEMIKSTLDMEVTGLKAQATFYYPKEGGSQTIADGLFSEVCDFGEYIFNEKVTEIRKKGNKWVVKTDKDYYKFDKLISTIPLPLLPSVIGTSKDIEEKIGKLKVNSLYTILIALKKPTMKRVSWINFGDFITRASFPANYSPHNVPKGRGMITTEITFRDKKPKNVEKRAVNILVKNGIIKEKDIMFTKLKKNKFAYIVPDNFYYKNIEKIRSYYQRKGLILAGRFGYFEYINIDKCMLSAKEIVEGLK